MSLFNFQLSHPPGHFVVIIVVIMRLCPVVVAAFWVGCAFAPTAAAAAAAAATARANETTATLSNVALPRDQNGELIVTGEASAMQHGGYWWFYFNDWGSCPGVDCCSSSGGCACVRARARIRNLLIVATRHMLCKANAMTGRNCCALRTAKHGWCYVTGLPLVHPPA